MTTQNTVTFELGGNTFCLTKPTAFEALTQITPFLAEMYSGEVGAAINLAPQFAEFFMARTKVVIQLGQKSEQPLHLFQEQAFGGDGSLLLAYTIRCFREVFSCFLPGNPGPLQAEGAQLASLFKKSKPTG